MAGPFKVGDRVRVTGGDRKGSEGTIESLWGAFVEFKRADGQWVCAHRNHVEQVTLVFDHPQAKATVTMKPEPPCPHCGVAWVKAAPEHVSEPRKTIKNTGFLPQNMLEYDCKCWRCSRTWTHAVETT